MDKVERVRLADVAYRRVRQAIISGELAGGAILREEVLGAELGLSRTPIREALLRLAGDDLVEARQGRSAVVKVMTRDDALSIVDAYWTVARRAFAVGADRLTRAELALATDRVKGFADLAGSDPTAGHMLLAEGWGVVYQASGNRELLRLLDMLRPRMERIVETCWPEGIGPTGVKRQRQLLAALRAGDTARAARLFDASHVALAEAVAAAFADRTAAAG